MEDRELIENELLVVKGASELYLHGVLEATTAEVHQAFKEALNESINIQNKLYNLMVEQGWYTKEYAEQNKIDCARKKFSKRDTPFC